MNAQRLLIAYAVVNAVLYSLLLPVWEGFDEPFHFAYIQGLANGHSWPDPRTERLSSEVGDSILLAPASQAVKLNLPQVTSYAEYFSLPSQARAEIRRRLYQIPPKLRWQSSQFINYEAHQPPLAYLALAVPERLLDQVPLPSRVAMLRIIGALAGSFLLLSAAGKFFEQIGMDRSYRRAAIFCLLSSQMTWATVAHVANDWLAVPIAAWTLVALIRYYENPRIPTVALSAVVLSAGLLTKAYFLSFVPLLLILCALRRRWLQMLVACIVVCGLAGPWYVRNLLRYSVLTGTQESRGGVGLHAALQAAPTIDWWTVIPSSLRWALWTGNNSFLTFSTITLNILIATGLAALLLWVATRHVNIEWIAVAYCGLYIMALGYATAVSHVYTGGVAMGPSPWYSQVLSVPLLGLMFLGASRWRRLGCIVAASLLSLFGYVLAATYAVKLLPLYGGYEGRTSIGTVTLLYVRHLRTLAENLDTVTLAPAPVLFALVGITVMLAFVQPGLLIFGIARAKRIKPLGRDQPDVAKESRTMDSSNATSSSRRF